MNESSARETLAADVAPWARVPMWLLSHPDLNLSDVAVYAAIESKVDKRPGAPDSCWPSAETIAGLAGVSARTVRRSVERLEAAGALTVRRGGRKADGTQHSNRYVVQYRQGDTMSLCPPQQGDTMSGELEPRVKSTRTKNQVQGVTSADADARAEIHAQFNDHFWPLYPPTNGIKREKQAALDQWRKLTIDDRRAAVRGARHKAAHFAATGEEPPYAVRFLRRRDFDDYQQPVVMDRATGKVRVVAEVRPCPDCPQSLDDHDEAMCPA